MDTKEHHIIWATKYVSVILSSIPVEHQHKHIRNTQNQTTTKRWVEGMIQQLLGVVHRQWVCWNILVHFRRQGGVSRNQFDTLVRRVEELVVMDPDEMLEGDKSLLKVSQNTLGKMCLTKQIAWIQEVEASRSAKRKEGVRQGDRVHSGMRDHVQTGGSGDEESQNEEVL